MMANRDYGDDDAVIIAASTLLLGCAAEESEVWQSKRKKRTVWVKPWLALREKFGAYQALVLEFTDTETDEYHRFMRMDHDTFMVIFYLCPRDRGGGHGVKLKCSFILTYVVGLLIFFPKWAHLPSDSKRLPRYDP